MIKKLLTFVAFAGLLAAPNLNAVNCTYGGYATGQHGNVGRSLASFTLTDGQNEQKYTVNQTTNTGDNVYYDLRKEDALVTSPGADISFKNFDWGAAEWMHAYLFVDYDRDGDYIPNIAVTGIPNEGSELVAYSYYEGYNSKGQFASDHQSGSDFAKMAFTLPSDLKPGRYNGLLKIDWNDITQCGREVGESCGVAVEFSIVIPGEGEVEAGDIEGTMTFQLDMSVGTKYPDANLLEPETIDVTASYADGKLTIYNFAELNPITFDLVVTTGKMTAANQVSFVDDYDEDDVWEYYYADLETETPVVYAQAYKLNDSQVEIIVNPWGDGLEVGDFFYFNSAFFNTVVTLDTTIEGLPEKPAPVPGITLGEVTATITDGIEEGSKVLNVSFTYETENLPEDANIYANITFGDSDLFDETEVEGGEVVFSYTEFEKGTYTVVLVAKTTEDGDVIATSNAQTFTVDQSGISDIVLENGAVRYFNLQGVEIVNPNPGNVYIRVEGSNATKVLVP